MRAIVTGNENTSAKEQDTPEAHRLALAAGELHGSEHVARPVCRRRLQRGRLPLGIHLEGPACESDRRNELAADMDLQDITGLI